MIATLGEPDLPVLVPESFHEQTDEELTETDIKRMDADDQAIQTILLGLLEDVYAAVDSCETAKEIWERVHQMMKGLDIGKQKKKAKLFNEWEKFTSTDGESIESYYHLRQTKNLHEADFTQIYDFLKMNQEENVGGNGGNQFGQYARQVAQNQQRYNAWQNGRIQGAQNAGQNAEEFDFMADAGDLDEIEEVNANCILMMNLQQASTSGTQHDKAPVYDTDGSVEVQLNDNCYDNEIFNMFTQEEQYTDLLEPIPEPQLVPQNDNHVISITPSMVHSGGTVETSFAPNEETRVFVPQTTKSKEELFLSNVSSNVSNMVTVFKTISIPNEDLSNDTTPSVAQKIISHAIAPIINQVDARVQNFEIQFLQEAAKFVRDFKSLEKEADKSLDKQKSLELEIERLLKASVGHDIIASNTLDPLNQKLESKIVELEFQVVNYEREISHLKTTYKNLFDSIKSNWAHAKLHDLIYENGQLRARRFQNTSESMKNTSGTSVTPYVDKPKLSVVTPLSKKLHATMPSHSIPQSREFNVVKHRNVIALGMFKINPS
nr:hypothetical protein [Tanacetum cinerariifolium]